MPVILVKDGEGNTIRTNEFDGTNFPPVPNMDEHLKVLRDLPARNDDVTLIAFPKSGTHWVWEIAQLLLNGTAELTPNGKMGVFIDFVSTDMINKMSSPRLLNSHVQPSLFPRDLIKRKCKFMYVMRNPKDAYVSLYHNMRSTVFNDYNGTWNGYFSLIMNGQTDYGNWFDFTTLWNSFFAKHPDIPVLIILYEELQKDAASGVQKIADFLNVPCSAELRDAIVQKCAFTNMKTVRDAEARRNAAIKGMFKGGEYPLFRKGQVGDWKSMFTVDQNERFDKEYARRMGGSSVTFKEYIGI